jgi:hypothetical protein
MVDNNVRSIVELIDEKIGKRIVLKDKTGNRVYRPGQIVIFDKIKDNLVRPGEYRVRIGHINERPELKFESDSDNVVYKYFILERVED